uniref:Putative secreted protein n=1 Tax=Ixodes ricinus TaxID=34613 RepID=A0A147BQW4_IXORI
MTCGMITCSLVGRLRSSLLLLTLSLGRSLLLTMLEDSDSTPVKLESLPLSRFTAMSGTCKHSRWFHWFWLPNFKALLISDSEELLSSLESREAS